jgi:A/G-specific adenine glycosylase
VLAWFDSTGRDFPWRNSRDPYSVLIAELLLQRTRADLIGPLYREFLDAFPNAAALAAADQQEIDALLRPLGLAKRTSRFVALGLALVERHAGRVPRSRKALLALPGVGPYTANAVLTLAFGRRVPLLDPNIIRLLHRALGLRSERRRPRSDAQLWERVAELLPSRRSREFSLGLLDLGAVICRARRPRCSECPLRSRCRAFNTGQVEPAPDVTRPKERLA